DVTSSSSVKFTNRTYILVFSILIDPSLPLIGSKEVSVDSACEMINGSSSFLDSSLNSMVSHANERDFDSRTESSSKISVLTACVLQGLHNGAIYSVLRTLLSSNSL